jgi:hypothetical protein
MDPGLELGAVENAGPVFNMENTREKLNVSLLFSMPESDVFLCNE